MAEQEQSKRKLNKQLRCIDELDLFIPRLYEEHVMDKLSDKHSVKLSEGYETEQRELKASVSLLKPPPKLLQRKLSMSAAF